MAAEEQAEARQFFGNTLVVIPGTKRPEAIRLHDLHLGGYTEIVAADDGVVIGMRAYRLELVGHQPCGWEHPTWPDESDRRMNEHLKTCELR